MVALVDSGAEHSVFGLELAEQLEFTLADAPRVRMFGVGDQEVPGHLLTVDHQLGRHRWTAPAIFSADIQSKAILGQAGFFEFFTVIFRRKRLEMDIRRSRSRVVDGLQQRADH